MPKIRAYQQQTQAQGQIQRQTQGSAQATDFGGAGLYNVGNAVQMTTQVAAQAVAILERSKAQREVSDVDVGLTELHTDLLYEATELSRRWTDNDPPFAETFSGILKARLDQAGYRDDGSSYYETAAGQAQFKQQAARVAMQMLQTATAIDAQLVGKAAETKAQHLIDKTGAFLQANPMWFQVKREQVATAFLNPDGEYARLSAVEKQRLIQVADQQFAVNAVQGLIRKFPNRALEILTMPDLAQDEQYGWIAKTIPNEKLSPLIEHARVGVRLQEAEARHAEADAKRTLEKAAGIEYSALTDAYLQHRIDPTAPPLTRAMILGKPDLMASHPEKALELSALLDRDAREALEGATKGNPYVYRDLWSMIAKNAMKDLSPINNARSAGQLTAEQHEELRKEFQEAMTPQGRSLIKETDEFMTRMEPFIMPKDLTGVLTDPESGLRMNKFTHDVRTQMEQDRKDGKNPFLRLNPDAPEYMGTPEILKRYVTPYLERIRKQTERLMEREGATKTPSGGVPDDRHRRPGETIAEWEKRVGKP